jgi:uncharacterized protein (DUF1684 family)
VISPEYRQKVLQWRSERETSLRKENGWLALSGLFWLKPGENRMGSDSANDIVLPRRIAASLGTIFFDGKQARLKVQDGLGVQVDGQPVTETGLQTDRDGAPSYITLDGISMLVIERPNGMGLRLWDNQRPERRLFPPREWFPINDSLRLPARYERYAIPRQVLLPDIFGEMQEAEMQGQVSFELENQLYTLDVSELEDHGLEIHFQDLTNGNQTYPSGRYYYSSEPVTGEQITLDFNFAYSPPCAFTEFATCVFAPPGNRLPVAIEAGEVFRGHP